MDLVPAPPGFAWTYCRMNEAYAKSFNGIPYEYEPEPEEERYKLLTEEAANFLAEHSCVREDPFDRSRNLYAITLQADPGFGKPFKKGEVGPELLDRSSGDYLVRPGEREVKTKPRLTKVGSGRVVQPLA